MERKKKLKMEYKQMKPEMGIYMISSHSNNKCCLQVTQNLRGAINRTKFQLQAGSHPNRELQKDWQEHGEADFTIEVLQYLDYDKDEAKTDYQEELAILQMIWEEKLAKEKREFY